MTNGESLTVSAATVTPEQTQHSELESLAATYSDEVQQQTQTVAPQSDNMPETSEILEPVIEAALAVLAPNWNVQKAEVEQLASCYGQLLDKYFPDGMGDYGLEINAIMITGAVLIPRLRTPRKVEAEKVEGNNDGD